MIKRYMKLDLARLKKEHPYMFKDGNIVFEARQGLLHKSKYGSDFIRDNPSLLMTVRPHELYVNKDVFRHGLKRLSVELAYLKEQTDK